MNLSFPRFNLIYLSWLLPMFLGMFLQIGCAPLKSTETNGASSGMLMGYDPQLLAATFSRTLQPVLSECSACHGVSQVPKFAVSDSLQAVRTIAQFRLVDLNNPANSFFIPHISAGHNGFGASKAMAIQSAIEAWAVALDPTNDQQDPVVMITAPAAAAVVSGTINLTAVATDNVGVVGVQFSIDGVNVGAEDATSPYSVSFNTTTLANGVHNVTARARDGAGRRATSTVSFTINNGVDTEAPTASIVSPANGATVSGSITITTSVLDNVGVVGVQLLVDGLNSGAEVTVPPYSLTLNTTTLANGSHTLRVRARDAAGNSAVSASVTVTVNNSGAGAVTFTMLANNVLNPICVTCHNAMVASGGRRFNSYAETVKAVVAGNPNASIMYTTTGPGGRMDGYCTPQEREMIRSWIAAGALNN